VSTERVRKLRFFEPRQYVSIDYARRDVLVIRINEDVATGGEKGEANANAQLAQAAAEFLTTGKLDAAVIQKLLAGGKVPAALMMKVLAAKNDPEKLKEIAKSFAGPQAEMQAESQDGPAPGLSFIKPEVTPGEPLKLEILSFLDAVRTRCEPRVTAQQGRAALELALTIQSTMATHAERAGLDDFFKSGL
jgi:hypothetical protein